MSLKDDVEEFLGGRSPSDEILKPAVVDLLRWSVALALALQSGDWDRVEAIRAEAGDGRLLYGLFLLTLSEIRREQHLEHDQLQPYLEALAQVLGGL